MKYWSAGDIDSSVYSAFFKARKNIGVKINALLASKNYLNDIDCLDVIYIIIKDGAIDKLSYKRKIKELNVYVNIDYDLFFKSTSIEQERILVDELSRVLKSKSMNKSIRDLNIAEFLVDLKNIQYGGE